MGFGFHNYVLSQFEPIKSGFLLHRDKMQQTWVASSKEWHRRQAHLR